MLGYNILVTQRLIRKRQREETRGINLTLDEEYYEKSCNKVICKIIRIPIEDQ